MARQCHITLIDFGFARALEPSDLLDDAGLKKVMDESYKTFLLTTSDSPQNSTNQKVAVKDDLLGSCLIDQALVDTSLRGLKSDDSVSRKQILDLSE